VPPQAGLHLLLVLLLVLLLLHRCWLLAAHLQRQGGC
jgi:hypothetical protein